MPHGEYGAGNSRHGEARERSRRKACGKAGILHADFDGKRLRLGRRKFQQFSKAESAAVTQQVVENHDGENDSARRKNFCSVVRNDRSHNHRDCNYRDEGQDFHGTGGPFAKKLVDDEPEGNRHDDDFHDGKKHGHHIHVHGGAKQQVGNRRRQHGSEQRIHAGHADRKRDIALREVGDNVTRSASWASSNKNHARHEGGIEPENLGKQKCECRHHDKLRRASNNDFFRARKDKCKVAQLEREPHAEHHDHQEVIHPAEFNPKGRFRDKQRKRRDG